MILNHHPDNVHWQAMKLIIQYLKVTTDVGLLYDRGCGSSSCVAGYVYSNYVVIWIRGDP